jgi:hypothetical protein
LAVLVSDTSVIIDLDRGALIEDLFRLPYEFAVPDLLFERELKGPLGDRMVALGLMVEELTPEEVTRAAALKRRQVELSTADTFACVIAEIRGWTLLTGDGGLRSVAAAIGLPMHGVLWLIDQLEAEGIVDGLGLHKALSAISAHPRCRLPAVEVRRRLTRWAP